MNKLKFHIYIQDHQDVIYNVVFSLKRGALGNRFHNCTRLIVLLKL